MPNEPRGPLGVPLRPPLQGSEAMRLVRREVRCNALPKLAGQLVKAVRDSHAAHCHKVTDSGQGPYQQQYPCHHHAAGLAGKDSAGVM